VAKDDMLWAVAWLFLAALVGFVLGQAAGARAERGWALQERVERLERRLDADKA
jgi:hypothetical protein